MVSNSIAAMLTGKAAWRIVQGDAREVLAAMPPGYVRGYKL